jgi:endo-1,4-beta-xylanase
VKASFFLFGTLLLLVACTPNPPSIIETPAQTHAISLRSLAQERGFLFGTAAAERFMQGDPTYSDTLAYQFNLLTPEDSMKFSSVHPEPGIYDFQEADALVAFASAHQMLVRGHTLVWDSQLPEWLTTGNYSRERLIEILRDHIQRVVSHFMGQVIAWDVVNEAFDQDGNLRDTIWSRGIGPQYISLAFEWAHQADPEAKLFYNDHGGEGMNAQSEAIYQIASRLLDDGVPIQGIGMQMHVGLSASPTPAELAANMNRLAKLGLQVQITEMDVRIGQESSPEKLARQAQIYGDTLEVCLQAENCGAMVVWGVSDRQSWISRDLGTPDTPTLFDNSYRPKPAYFELVDVLGGK